MVMGGCKGVWEGVMFFRKCDIPQEVRRCLKRFVSW